MNSPWQIYLLGALRAETAGGAVPRFRTRQAGALLARLALFPRRAHAREELVDLLWPDADQEAGRNRLRVTLASLRRQLEPPGVATGSVLIAHRTHVQLNPDAVRCDAVEFEAALARAARAPSPSAAREAYEQAAQLYRGDLLPGFYDDWVSEERERLRALYDDLCDRLPHGAPPQYASDSLAPAPPVNPSPHLYGVPLPLSRFFGREGERARLAEMLADPAVRLVTLSGPGGAGKTRLAVEAARAAQGGPVCWAGLADLDDVRLIASVIARVLGLAPSPSREPLDLVSDALNGGLPTLLVLDNLEHLVERGAPLVQSLLTRVPTLTCLVTSRRRLALPGERELPVPPLTLPPMDGTAAQVAMSESARLFVDRAQAARPDFQITARNAGDVAALCRDLEGLPLALELAAARVGSLTVAEMRQKLAQRFVWLASRRTDKSARHRSLWATLAWSFDLLSPPLQRFFAQLSVFRGGCTVETAEAVCEESQALELLSQLRERSLALVEEGSSGLRFRLLESVREFAGEQLSADEQEGVCARHRDFFLAEAERAELCLVGAEAPVWLIRLRDERDNLRAALDDCLRDDTPEGKQTGLRLAGALGRFWQMRGELTEGRECLAAALARPGAEGPSEVRAWALRWAGLLALHQGDFAAASAHAAAAWALFEAQGEARGVGWSRVILGTVVACQGEHAEARPHFEAALALFRECGDARGVSAVLNNLGCNLLTLGKLADAEPLLEESLAIHRAAGNWPASVVMLTNLGTVAFYKGDLAEARRRLEESLALRTGAGLWDDQPCYTLAMLAAVALDEGRLTKARALLAEGMTACRAEGDRRSAGNLLEFWANLCWAENRPDLAARSLGSAARVLQETGGARDVVGLARHEADVAQVQVALGAKAFAAAWAVGEALTWQQAVAKALEDGEQMRR